MYKILLSWRYLRTRFIALASIISVTLGVATLIVVNSVMSGFVDQMKSRLHGILSDVEISAPLLGQITNPEFFVEDVKKVVGDDLESLTCVVRTPGMMTSKFQDRPMTQQIILLGIDDDSFGKVTDFQPYLQNAVKREQFSFALEKSGYQESLDVENGWEHRRRWAEFEQFKREMEAGYDGFYQSLSEEFKDSNATNGQSLAGADGAAAPTSTSAPDRIKSLPPLPDKAPEIGVVGLKSSSTNEQDFPANISDSNLESATADLAAPQERWPSTLHMVPFDSHSQMRPTISRDEMFDPKKDQRTGIILGVALARRKTMDAEDKLIDFYMIRPGEDVQIMIPTVGTNAQAVMEKVTVVDFYASNMHEYDSMFAFMPLSALQKLRGMVDPFTGIGSVSTIQIKLKPNVSLNEVRDRLLVAFPVDLFGYDIQTWLDTQAPLLSAVQMELKILNILLFLIIAVAGFGILATFYMIVVEKTKDIGILKALGAPGSGIMSIFLGYGLSLGLLGTGSGILLGLGLATNINEIADGIEFFTGREVFDPQIYYFSEIPTLISPWMVFSVAVGAVLIAVMASVLPAIRAARLHPVEALRYE